jgi:hypothetical protein
MGIARNTQCCCARAVYSSQFCRRVDYTTPRYNPDDRVAWSHNASRPNRATSIDTCVVGEAGAYILASLFTLAFFNRFEAHFSGPTLPLPQNGPLTSLFSVSQIGPFLKFPPVLKQRLRVLFLQASELRIARTTRKEYPRPSTVCCSEYGAGREHKRGDLAKSVTRSRCPVGTIQFYRNVNREAKRPACQSAVAQRAPQIPCHSSSNTELVWRIFFGGCAVRSPDEPKLSIQSYTKMFPHSNISTVTRRFGW